MYKIKSIRIYSQKNQAKDFWSRKIDKVVPCLKAYRERIIEVASKRYNCSLDVSFEYSIKNIDTKFEIYKGFEIFESEKQSDDKIACRRIVNNKYLTKHFKNVFEAKSYADKHQ